MTTTADNPAVQPAQPVEPAAQPTPPVQPAATPDPVFAGKFKTVEDLERGYVELERKMGQQSQQPPAAPAADPPAAPAQPATTPTPEEADILAKTGLDPNVLVATWKAAGQLTTDDYAALRKQGVTREIVDAYMRGQQAVVDGQVRAKAEIRSKALAKVGGEQQFNNLVAWAKANLTPAEIASFNSRVEDPALWEGAVGELVARHQQHVGGGPGVISTGTPAGGAVPFASVDEWMAAQEADKGQMSPAFLARLNATDVSQFGGC